MTPMPASPGAQTGTRPAPFTADFAARMACTARMADEEGLAGVLVTPGPDLLYLCGYAPIAITERLTMLVVSTAREPAMIVPLSMLRAVKDTDEPARLAAAGAAAGAAFYDLLEVRFSGRKEPTSPPTWANLLRKHGHSRVDFTVVGSGPNGANPHHEIGERVARGRRHGRPRLRRDQERVRVGHDADRARRRADVRRFDVSRLGDDESELDEFDEIV